MRKAALIFSLVIVLSILVTGCIPQATAGLKVVATTTIIGDIVSQVGGNRVNLTVIIPAGADPHTYEPRPLDAAAIHDAAVVFTNGLGLEHSLETVISNNASGKVIEVSNGVNVLPFSASSGDSDHASGDPHTWMDPNNVKIWVENIRQALTQADPTGADIYKANADAYLVKLSDLDTWITQQVAQVPVDKRKLVTDHESLGYFANRYQIQLVGLILPSLSTNASPSASDLAQVENVIKKSGIKTIFIEMGASDAIASQIASDTGVNVARLYNGSLGAANSGASTYIDFMHFNVNTIVIGLR